MEKVTGIGGLFLKANDPKKLTAWYVKHLGISPVPRTYDDASWWQDEGPTVFETFDDANEYFGKYQKPWIINFRVRDLDAMVDQLQSAGIEVEVDPEKYPNGRFASLFDPEGNPIQLWQPEGKDLVHP